MTPDDLPELAEAAVEGRLTDEQAARLEQLVLADPAARAFYVEYLSVHAVLRVPAGPATPTVRPRRRGAERFALAAAMAVGFGLAGWLLAPRPPAAVAVLADAQACRWDAGSLPTAAGSALPPGRLRLAEGLARVRFAGGAEVRLEGPADLQLVGPGRCVLHAGRLTATVPPPAVGFVVETPSSVVTDYGTDFGVSVNRGNTADVQVFSGLVEVAHRATGESRELRTGAGLRLTPEAVRAFDADAGPDRPDRPTDPPPGLRPLVLTTAQGAGRDGSVQPPTPGPHPNHSATLLLVKRAEPGREAWHRRAFLGFDLSGVGTVTDAELGLTFAPTRMGFAALVPDCLFAVYGLPDGPADDWAEGTLAWDGGPLDPAAVRVGEFVVPQGQQAGRFSVGGPALLRFLRADTNRLATLVVVRETAGLAANDLVHGIASRHPTLAPPTLRLTVADRGR